MSESKHATTKPKTFTRSAEPELTDISTYNTKNMVFGEMQENLIPGSIIKYKRLPIQTKYRNGTTGDLILGTGRLFAFGVQENTDPQDKTRITGHSLSFPLWGREGPTSEEKVWYDKFLEIVECIRNYIFTNRNELELYDLKHKHQLERIDPLYRKKEKGVVVDSIAPVLSAKLLVSKSKDKDKAKDASKEIIRSLLFDINGNKLDAYSIVGQRCFTTAAVKVESVYFGGGKSVLQLKLHEAVIEPVESGMKPLISNRPKSTGLLITGGGTNLNEMKTPDDDDEDEPEQKKESKPAPGSVENSDDDEPVKPATPPPAKPVRKLGKIVKKTAT